MTCQPPSPGLRRITLFCWLAIVWPTMLMAADVPTIRIGSKSFTESVVLGEVLAHLVRHSGAKVVHRAELGGTQILWKALLAGEIDLYVDYTGTISEEICPTITQQAPADEAQMRQILAGAGVVMSDRVGFNNTYALGMRRDVAAQRSIKSISQLQPHAALKLGLSDEFIERHDGWYQLAERYQLPHTRVRTMDHNMAYRGLVHGAIDVTDLYTTDAEIQSYDLQVLEDDQNFFPTYYAVVLMRADLAQRAPQAAQAVRRIEGLIQTAEMVAMTAAVRMDGIPEVIAAGNFLNQKLGLQLALPGMTRFDQLLRIGRRLAKTTAEHLFLVAVSLSLAVLVAVPLGIASARHERLGQMVLGTVSVIQTLPSMALLVFMIPLFGLGPVPAIAALFCYSLLPIVRNTYAGLQQIPAALRESAEALGLDANSRLKLVEFPLALPSVLSGIKTAAVINVGTATIGALIGAGGYGAPILTGIRLSSTPLILQGAVPAALMAVAVQFGFGLLEQRLVSPGLRPKR